MTEGAKGKTSHRAEHTCHTPMFTGIIPGCKRCEEIAEGFGFEPYSWHTMRMAQSELKQNHQGDTNND